MSAQNGVNEYWESYVQARLERLSDYTGEARKDRLIIMLVTGLAPELRGLTIYKEDETLAYTAELLAAWQQIIKEVMS